MVSGLPKLALLVKGNQLLHLQPYMTPVIYKLYDTIVNQEWNLWTGALRVWIPHLFCLMTKFCTISMNMWTRRIAGTGLQITPYYATKCHYMTLHLVCGVLQIQLELSGPFFYCRPCSHTNTIHTSCHLFLYTHLIITRESMPFPSRSQCKKFNLLREGFWWENSKQMTVPAQFVLVEHVNSLVLKFNYSSSEPSAHF